MQGLSTGAERSKEKDGTRERVPADPRGQALLEEGGRELVSGERPGVARLLYGLLHPCGPKGENYWWHRAGTDACMSAQLY